MHRAQPLVWLLSCVCYATLKTVKADSNKPSTIDPLQAGNGGARKRILVTLERYEEMLKYWTERPSIAWVARACRVSPSVVQRVVTKGVPELGLDPFPGSERIALDHPARKKDDLPRAPVHSSTERVQSALGLEAMQEAEQLEADIRNRIRNYEQESIRLDREIDMMRRRGVSQTSLDALRSAFGRIEALERTLVRTGREAVAADQMRKSAEEAAASRLSLRTAASVSAMVSHLVECVLDNIENGSIELPKVLDAKTIALLARAADTSASAVERAMTIERKRLGQPESVLGIQVGALLNDVSDEELAWIIKHQQMPPRLAAASGATVLEAHAEEPETGEPEANESSDG